MRLKALLLICCLYSLPATAGWETGMMNAFAKMGVRSNLAGPDALKSQQSSMVYGGQASLRAPADDINLSNFQAPSIRFGDMCAMDIFGGAFSFVNADEALAILQNIGSAAAVFTMQLVIKQMAPQIQDLISDIQDKMDKLNFHNINACNTGKALVNRAADSLGFLSQKTAENDKVKKDQNDRYSAKKEMEDQSKINAANKEISDDEEKTNLTPVYKNIAWHAIQSNATLKKYDINTKYLLMNLTGTVIIKPPEDDAPVGEQIYMSKLVQHEEDFLKALHTKNSKFTLKLNVCKDKEKCLEIEKDQPVEFEVNQSFYAQTYAIIKKMRTALEKNQDLSQQEDVVVFIRATQSLPILSSMRREVALGVRLGHSEHYADVIATELLMNYINESIGKMQQAFGGHPFPKDQSERFEAMLKDAKEVVARIQAQQFQQSARAKAFFEQTELLGHKMQEAVFDFVKRRTRLVD